MGETAARPRRFANLLQKQARRYENANFLFLDLKLNSNPALFGGIAEHAKDACQAHDGPATVHVDNRADNGLSERDLRAAAANGMRRVSFGLESGSQRLLELMVKGASVERNRLLSVKLMKRVSAMHEV